MSTIFADQGAQPRTSSDGAAAAGRLFLATIFLVSGFAKLAQPAGVIGYIASAGLPLPTVALGLAILLEVGGGVLLVLGYRSRLVAGLLALFSIVTALVFHSALGDQNQLNHFLKNIAIAGGLLQIVAFGPGRYRFGRG